MDQENFDDRIKNIIKDTTSDKQNEVWERINATLDATNSEGIDDILHKNINEVNSQIPDQKELWIYLERTLTAIEQRKDNILHTKLIEVFTIALFIITFLNWQDNMGGSTKPSIDEPQNFATASDLSPISLESEINVIPAKIEKSPKKIFHKGVTQRDPAHYTPIKNNNLGLQAVEFVNSSYPSEIAYDNVRALDIEEAKLIDDLEILQSAENTIQIEKYVDNDMNHVDHIDQFNASANQKTIIFPDSDDNNISPLRATDLKALESEYALILPVTSRIKHNERKEDFLSVFTSADINLINTPFDKIYSIASYSKEALSQSFGMSFSRRKEKLEWEAGISYTRKSYEPIEIEEIYNASDITFSLIKLNKIQFDIMQMPLSIKYNFINQKFWSAYVMGCVALNTITNTQFDIQEEQVYGRLPLGIFDSEEPKLKEKPFYAGIFEGGSLLRNLYITSGVGFGIEGRLSKNISTFIQPSYQAFLFNNEKGLGPNRDKINNTSILFGMKYTLRSV